MAASVGAEAARVECPAGPRAQLANQIVGVTAQIEGNVIQSTSRALMEEVSFDRGTVATREWGAYPIIKFPEVPKIDVLMLKRPIGVSWKSRPVSRPGRACPSH